MNQRLISHKRNPVLLLSNKLGLVSQFVKIHKIYACVHFKNFSQTHYNNREITVNTPKRLGENSFNIATSPNMQAPHTRQRRCNSLPSI